MAARQCTLGRGLAAMLLAALACLATPAPALAHSVLQRTEPENGAALPQGPRRVRLIFNEPVEVGFIPLTVRNGQGTRMDQGDGGRDPADPRVVQVNVGDLTAGVYTVNYRVISGGDGHIIQGSFGFTVGTVAVSGPVVDTAATDASDGSRLGSLAHGAAQGVAVSLAGLMAFVALIWLPLAGKTGSGRPDEPLFGRWAVLLAALLVVIGLVEIADYGIRAAGEPLSLGLLARTMGSTRFGRLWPVRILLALLAAASAMRAGRLRQSGGWWLATGLGAGLLATLSLQSHAAAAGALPLVADWLHLVAAAPWIGGLLGFAIAGCGPRRHFPAPERVAFLGQAVPRFSRLALVAVIILTATGIYGTVLHVPNLAALTQTAYGQSLLVKLALLLPLLALGAVNLASRGRGAFGPRIAGELLLAAGIFVAAGLLTTSPPARAALLARQGPFAAVQTQDGFQIRLGIQPTAVGFNEAIVNLNQPDGTAVADAVVSLRVTMTEHDMGLQNPDAEPAGPGAYRVRQLVLGMHGVWRVEVAALTSQGREVRAVFTVPVPEP